MKKIRKLFQKLKEQSGVTLIELLAVVVILGIIAAVAVPKILNTKADALKSTGQSDANVLTELAKRHIFDGMTYDKSATAGSTTNFSLTTLGQEASLKVTTETDNDTATLDDNSGNVIGTLTIDPSSGDVTFQ